MKPSLPLKQIALAFLAAILIYAVFYNGIEHRRTWRGPWLVTFTNAASTPTLIVNQPVLNISDLKITFPGQIATNMDTPVQFATPQEVPFDVQWLPAPLNVALVFYTGDTFDQLVYTDVSTGAMSFAIFALAEYGGAGTGGKFEFTEADSLEDDDTWSNSAYDVTTNKLYFQCSDVDPESGIVTITLCQVDIPKTAPPKPLYYVNTAIEPMTYGYVGMQYVQVVA